jgi:endonuclease/exonuclease/phosphatase family metal-dependent hydrolase
VDGDSSRTCGLNQRPLLNGGTGCDCFALNFSCPFVPNPKTLIVHPLGRINSGLYTVTDGLGMDRAERVALPCPFSWPLRIANLKRCLLVSYLPLENSDRQLVLVNLHLEAYDDGEGKIAQTNQLREFIRGEYEKGNYVIAGGDFNQVFPGSLERYPNTHTENWEPGVLDASLLPEGWTLACDLSTPSCRLLNQPYDPSDTAGTQHYVIDGLILSPNVELKEVKTLDLGFADSDHNPVHADVVLKDG